MKKVLSFVLSALMLITMFSTVAFAAAPIITSQPTDSFIVNGEDAVYYIEAQGADLTYQWYGIQSGSSAVADPNEDYELTDGDYYYGTTTETLWVNSTWAMSGDPDCNYNGDMYYCVVTNNEGSVISDIAEYVVTDHRIEFDNEDHWAICDCAELAAFDGPHIDNGFGVCTECNAYFDPDITITGQPRNVSIKNGQDAVFTVQATGNNLTYQWCYLGAGEDPTPSMSGNEIEDNEYFHGTNTNTLTVTSTWRIESYPDCNYNGDMYYCIISDANGSIVTNIAYYYVTDHPTELTYDRYDHWSACNCDAMASKNGPHADSNGDGACDVCKLYYVHPFKDVTDKNVWYYKAAEYCRWEEYFKGDTQGLFNGSSAITRAEAATVITRVLWDLDDFIEPMTKIEFSETMEDFADEYGNGTVVGFNDVSGKWYERYAVALANLGILTGYEDGSFGGERLITRQEIATIMYRVYTFMDLPAGTTFGQAAPAYTDAADVASWAKNNVEWARTTGLFIGDEYGKFNPLKNCTRAEFAQLLVRYDEGVYGAP